MRVLSGIQPSGRLHLGNYFGAVRQFLKLQEEENECFYFLANYHALTTISDSKLLNDLTHHLAAGYLALGVDPEKSIFFLQSDVPEVTELCWFLNAVCPESLMRKSHAYKDKMAQGANANMALLDYPVLQAADILSYNADLVPVGQDQKQHIEMTRDLASKFNKTFKGDYLTIPESVIVDDVAIVPGIDGRKMSKSYNNTIEIFQTAKKTKKNCGKIVTDSTPVDEPKDPGNCNVFALLKLLASPNDLEELANKYTNGLCGYGDAKKMLAELINEKFAGAREKYLEYENDKSTVMDILRDGGNKAREIASQTLANIRDGAGILTTY